MDAEPRATVAAVLVAHDGAGWLPKVLTSLSTMDVAPVAWHAVDVSSTDGSADYLRQSFGSSRITFAAAGTGFGDAVRIAVDQLPETDWLWLLHDDAIVTPSTLAGLLAEATTSPDIAVVGPKVREWPSLRRLLEVGVTVTGTGARVTGLEAGEPDAGQYDRPRTVLAVSSAGMLVRREVWDALGGFDPNLPLYFDDVDFCWRVARAGHRVRTAPLGVLFHAEASARGSRKRSAGDVATWEHRRAALYTVLANCGGWRFPLQYVRMLLGSLIRVLGLLLLRNPEGAGDELLAIRDVYRRGGPLRAARRVRAPFALRPHGEIAALLPPWWLPYRHGIDVFVESVRSVIKPESIETGGRRSKSVGPSPDPDELADGPSLLARRPWFVLVLGVVAAAVLAARGLNAGDLHSAVLPPVPSSAGGWWSLMFERRHDVGLDSTAFGPPYALLLGFAALPVWWAPGLLIKTLVLGAVPLAALSAHRLGRLLIDHRPIRYVWAISYGLLVAASGAVQQGRLGTIVALVVAPIIVNTFLHMRDESGWQIGLRLGIWTAVATAFAPISFWMVLTGAAILLAVERQWVARTLAIAGVTTTVLLGPWMVQRVVRPGRVWWEAGNPVDGPLDVGVVPAAAGVLLVLLAVVALVPAASRQAVQWAWVVALAGSGFVVLGLTMTHTTAAGQSGVIAWIGVPAGVALGALATAVALAAVEVSYAPPSVLVPAAVAALLVPTMLGGWWLVRGDDAPLTAGPSDVVPAYLAERPGSTVVVTGSVEHGVSVRVVAGAGPTLGQEAVTRDTDAIASAIGDLFSSPYGDGAVRLARAGVDAVYAPDADRDVVIRLDAVAAFAPAGADRPGSRVWTVELDEPVDRSEPAGVWRWGLGLLQTLLWIVAVVLTAPVRKREQPGELIDDAPFDGVIPPAAGGRWAP